MNYLTLANQIKLWAKELGFQQAGICHVDLKDHEATLQKWLDAGYHGNMEWMERHGMMRARPDELLPGTLRVISVRMDYLPPQAQFASNLNDPNCAYISRYALGRDYHKLVRNQLKKLGEKIAQELQSQNLDLGYRPFVDSAPILERPLAEKAGLGWRGKHSLLINQQHGSWFFLGELLVNIPLPVDIPSSNQCGKCSACLSSCPTQAIIKEGVVDARRCISYLTIEYDGVIPINLRKAMGNRIYGCDDCQLVCPWNRFAQVTQQQDFHRREYLTEIELVELFNWSEEQFLHRMQGSPIRRIGYHQWLRNLSIAMGNAPHAQSIVEALQSRLGISELLDEHIYWALAEQSQQPLSNDNRQHQRLIRIIEKGLKRDA